MGRYALNNFLPILEVAGFEWVEKNHEGYNAQVNSISFERHYIEGQFDWIVIGFDKYLRPKFQIYSGTKEKSEPYKWIRAGDIVRYQSELDKAKWWGARWWQLNKMNAFKANVDKVARILPQLIDFLSNGTVGANIYEHDLSAK